MPKLPKKIYTLLYIELREKPPELDKTELYTLLKKSLEFELVLPKGEVIKYRYDPTTNTIKTIYQLYHNTFYIDEFIRVIESTEATILKITFLGELDLWKWGIVKVNKVVDYPSIITQLVERKSIETKPSDLVMAVDPRQFRFVEDDPKSFEQLGQEEAYYEVDCLGTILGQELSSRVKKLWLT